MADYPHAPGHIPHSRPTPALSLTSPGQLHILVPHTGQVVVIINYEQQVAALSRPG